MKQNLALAYLSFCRTLKVIKSLKNHNYHNLTKSSLCLLKFPEQVLFGKMKEHSNGKDTTDRKYSLIV